MDSESAKNYSPALCLKTYNPYTFCPFKFTVSDEEIGRYSEALLGELKRVNNLPMQMSGEDDKS